MEYTETAHLGSQWHSPAQQEQEEHGPIAKVTEQKHGLRAPAIHGFATKEEACDRADHGGIAQPHDRVVTQKQNLLLQEAKDRLTSTIDEEDLAPSHFQEIYLLEIYNLTQSQDIELILLKTPIHELKQEFEDIYMNRFSALIEEQLPNATIIDHSRVEIPEEGFGDLEHLNAIGAELYSDYLKEHGFVTLADSEQ